MLPAAHRMRRRQDFTVAVRRGRRAGDQILVVHLLSSRIDGGIGSSEAAVVLPARIGFVVPKAVGNAVVRKRVTRRLRHLVRDRLERVPDDTLLVVRALPASADASYDALGIAFDRAWERVSRTRPARSSG